MRPEFNSKKYNWLVTGCAGFIGSHLVEALLKSQQNVIGLDDFSTGCQENLNQVLDSSSEENFKFHRGDIRNRALLQSILKNVDFVLHHAALASVPASLENPADCFSVNVQGFAEILEASKISGVKKVIYASSSAVYGDDPAEKKREESVGNPLSPYGVSKLMNETLALSFSKIYGLPTVGFRYFNVFGTRQSPTGPYAAVIPLWIEALLNKEQPKIYGDGLTSRDFCSVDLVVKANIRAALSVAPNSHQIVNVGSGRATSLKELFNLILQACSSEKIQLAYTNPLMLPERKGDIKHSLADCSRLNQLLGEPIPTNLMEDLTKLVIHENEKK